MSAKVSPKRATIPSVADFDHANPWEGLRVSAKVSPKRATIPSRFCIRPRQSLGRVARVRQSVAKTSNHSLAFLHSTTPIPGKGCACPPKCRQNEQPFPALLILTTPIPGKGCACPPKCRQNEQPFPALLILTTRIPGKGCSCPPKFVILPRVQSLDHANPWEGLRVAPTSWKTAILPRIRAFDHANPWEGLRVTPTRCHFTTRSRARPRQSMVRVAFPTEASVPAPALERIFKL